MNSDAIGAFTQDDAHEELVWCGVEHYLLWKERQ